MLALVYMHPLQVQWRWTSKYVYSLLWTVSYKQRHFSRFSLVILHTSHHHMVWYIVIMFNIPFWVSSRSLRREHWQLNVSVPGNIQIRFATLAVCCVLNWFLAVALFQDISLNQWLALTPPELVKAHLGLDDATIARLSKVKQEVVGPAS
jgi:hypothetical protein